MGNIEICSKNFGSLPEKNQKAFYDCCFSLLVSVNLRLLYILDFKKKLRKNNKMDFKLFYNTGVKSFQPYGIHLTEICTEYALYTYICILVLLTSR